MKNHYLSTFLNSFVKIQLSKGDERITFKANVIRSGSEVGLLTTKDFDILNTIKNPDEKHTISMKINEVEFEFSVFHKSIIAQTENLIFLKIPDLKFSDDILEIVDNTYSKNDLSKITCISQNDFINDYIIDLYNYYNYNYFTFDNECDVLNNNIIVQNDVLLTYDAELHIAAPLFFSIRDNKAKLIGIISRRFRSGEKNLNH